ncbi:MAG TPA: hypothetical protein DD412_00225 [Holosporales bacterium]|nr:hypothetical protein [Holosporales bacterium]
MNYITVAEFARELKCSNLTIYRAINQGLIKDYKKQKMGIRKTKIIINPTELNRFKKA